MKSVVLKKGREASLLRRHPWIFSGAVQKAQPKPKNGETVLILRHDGTPLAVGAFSGKSQIRVRIWSFDPTEPIDAAFFHTRIKQALAKRQALKLAETSNAYRLISSEADGLPGLIVDRYADFAVLQFLSAGAEFWKKEIVAAVNALLKPRGIYERSDSEARQKEGLQAQKGVLTGAEPPDRIEIEEHGLRFLVDVKNGHKTGFYLDQRANRLLVRRFAAGKEVLNCFAYTGGFGLAAAQGKAKHIVNVEAVGSLIAESERNVAVNDLNAQRFEHIKGDVFKLLRRFTEEDRLFDLIVLDPPKFAERQSHLPRAARGYKDINLQAFKLLRPGGYLFTFSCSGLMKPDLFRKIVADAALDAGRQVQILRFLSQDADHPVALHIPESEYLKGLLLKVW